MPVTAQTGEVLVNLAKLTDNLAMKVNILEAKNRLSELIRAVQAGEEVIIANRGEPVARLTGVAPTPAHPVGSAAAILALMDWTKRNPLPQESRRSPGEIDAYIQEMRDDWPD